jgi:hypothetical protein
MKKLFLLPILFLIISGCDDEPSVSDQADLRLILNHVVDDAPLQLNTERYTNAAGQAYNITKFRYYVSNIRLRNTRTGEVYIEPESYHLVGTESGNSFEILLSDLPLGEFNQLEFAIGVDNSTNTSTDRLGALDPSNDMAWDWNTGYKFILLEGNYFPDNADVAPLVYHVGGDPNYRILTYTFGQSALPELDLGAGEEHRVNMEVNVAELFRTPNLVSFAEHPVVMFDPFSQKIADNYASDMFIIQSIE